MQVLAKMLIKNPMFNSSWRGGGEYVQRSCCNIGFAVETPEGLVVPVIKDVDQKNIQQLAAEIQRLSEKARTGLLDKEDISGGCTTISSLGGIGGGHFSPIVNAPEAFILGLSKASMQPVYENGIMVPKLLMPFSLSYDHRLIDGADGARFVVDLAQRLTKLVSEVESEIQSYIG